MGFSRQEYWSKEDLLSAVRNDHVCAQYRKNYRSVENFLTSDVLVMDIDNTGTADPAGFITEEKMNVMFPDICYALVPSRNHMKPKGSNPPAPRYHVFFPVNKTDDPDRYTEMKEKLYALYPFFDGKALDAARFLYGSAPDDVVWHEGWVTIDEDLETRPVPEKEPDSPTTADSTIKEGSRNNTMSRFAGRVLTRFGNTEKAKEAFLTYSRRCDPPLDNDELRTIWESAVRFYEKKAVNTSGYVRPEDYNREFPGSLKPRDYSDMGQARALVDEYGDEIRFNPATGYLRYNGVYWEENAESALGAAEEFVDLQLEDSLSLIASIADEMRKAGLDPEEVKSGKLKKDLTPEQQELIRKYFEAVQYFKFVMKRRDYKYLKSALDTARPMVYIGFEELDRNEYLLNTPSGTYDLRKGLAGMQEHKAADYLTKVTKLDPGEKGKELWEETLRKTFLGDAELIDYVQTVIGSSAVGKVFVEALIIAYGEGRNGKSTFWNTVANVLGTYSGHLSADTLTVGCKRNVKPEMAETKGKRMIIAAELEEGMRLNTSVVKQLCSTDEVFAEKKYKAPASFIPSHTVVLYTNHLPRVGASDEGTWRRLIVIPFNAVFEGANDRKNFADSLYREAGPAILTWIIEGAKKAIDCEFHFRTPRIVQEAIDEYRAQSDWLGDFLESCCEVDPEAEESSNDVYQEYRNYCDRIGEFKRNQAEFYAALESVGIRKFRKHNSRCLKGVRLKEKSFLS